MLGTRCGRADWCRAHEAHIADASTYLSSRQHIRHFAMLLCGKYRPNKNTEPDGSRFTPRTCGRAEGRTDLTAAFIFGINNNNGVTSRPTAVAEDGCRRC